MQLATIDVLRQTFDGHLISRNGDVNWSSRSWDLTPLIYFLWDAVNTLTTNYEIIRRLYALAGSQTTSYLVHTNVKN